MNFSSSSNSTVVVVRDDMINAIMKNIITVTLCLSINYINVTLVYTFFKHEIFRLNPRYILYIHLVINDILLLTLLTLIQVLSYIFFSLPVWLCTLLIALVLGPNLNTPMTLAIMAIDCYVAVCFPLRHSQIITVKRTYIIIGLIWLTSAQSFLPELIFSLATEQLDFFHSRAFCEKSNIFRMPGLDMKDTVLNIALLVVVWLILIYTYFKILFAAKSVSADAKKARNTVLLHSFQLILSMLTYIQIPVAIALTQLLPQSILPIRYGLAVFVNMMPRLVSPLAYGIRDKNFRIKMKIYLVSSMNLSSSSNSTVVVLRDDLTNAIMKNIITVTLCLSINYINVTLVYTFFKHEGMAVSWITRVPQRLT
ncbi:hypothetical protein WMY93_011490 [Mugilogobius chulae]|uniref:G-protein coupled receptors family 1 profile domain-containing protein n=1 Tax=Mugilogobius chulae TaxID=88201 RepID=A0AAW0PBP1_9GOBI